MREINLTTKIAVYLLEECSEMEKKLIDAAKSATTKAYAPYSGFRVCAERTALFFANATHPDQKVEAVAVAAWHNGTFTHDVITPCGACRQVLLEAENRFQSPVKVLMYSEDGIYVVTAIKDLLPLSFGDEMLK